MHQNCPSYLEMTQKLVPVNKKCKFRNSNIALNISNNSKTHWIHRGTTHTNLEAKIETLE